MTPITVEQYFGKYIDHPDATPERKALAAMLLEIVNEALAAYEADGGVLRVNPHTGCYIGGDGNGGFRPHECPIGAPGSQHKKSGAIDIYDPKRELAAWSVANESILRHLGIVGMEDPRWTPTWAHWQDVEVASGHFVFIPSRDKALAGPVPGQVLA